MNLLSQYKKILNPNAKILNVTHKDLDGVASSIIVKNVFKNIRFASLKYGDVNSYLKNLDFSDFDVVLLTDISPESEEGFCSDKIFLLDHHDSALRYHSPENNRIVISGRSATILVKEFFENLFHLDLSYLNDFCNIVNDYDMWQMNDPRSWMMNELYFKYYDEKFRIRFKNGDVKFNEDEQEFILERKKEFNKTYKDLIVYELDNIKGCFFINSKFVNDICHKLMNEEGYKITFNINPSSKSCSIRSMDDNLHVGEMLQNLNLGGGHMKAGAFRVKEIHEIQTKIEIIEEYILTRYKEFRKNV